MLLNAVRGRRILFVGGKGGVGKTTVSASLGYALAASGQRVLVASTDPAHNLGHLFRTEVGDEPVTLAQTPEGVLLGIELDPKLTAERHFESVRKTMLQLLPERLHRAATDHLSLASAAPGSHEAAMLERIAEISDAAGRTVDTVIFDTAPTGHTLRLLSLPERLTGWAEQLLRNRDRSDRYATAMGSLVTGSKKPDPESDLRRVLTKRRDRFAALRETIHSPDTTGFVAVTIAESMPLAETEALVEELQTIGIDLAALVINRRAPVDQGAALADRRRVEDAAVTASALAGLDAPIVQVPLLPGELTGPEAVARLASHL